MKKNRKKIPMNVYYKKEIKKTKIWNMEKVQYNFKLYWNDWKKYYVVRFNWNDLMPMMMEAFIAKYWMQDWTARFEEVLEILREIQKKWHNPFWLFIAKYINPNENN